MPNDRRRSKPGRKKSPTETKALRMVERLRQQYELGCRALAARNKGISTAQFGAAHGFSEHTIRKFKAFARGYTAQELGELCRLRRHKGNGEGLPLHWVTYRFCLLSRARATGLLEGDFNGWQLKTAGRFLNCGVRFGASSARKDMAAAR
jgi:hypothetical protein